MNLRDMADLLADKNLVNMALEVDMVATKLKQGEMIEVTALVTRAVDLLAGDVVIKPMQTTDALTVLFTDVTRNRNMFGDGERFLQAKAKWTSLDGTEVERPPLAEDYCSLDGGARIFRPVAKGQILSEPTPVDRI